MIDCITVLGREVILCLEAIRFWPVYTVDNTVESSRVATGSNVSASDLSIRLWSDCNFQLGSMACTQTKKGLLRALQRRGSKLGTYALFMFGIMLVSELVVAVRAQRVDYVDFFEEKKREQADLNMSRSNSTSAQSPNSREGGSLADAFDKMLEKEFPDKEDPQEGENSLHCLEVV